MNSDLQHVAWQAEQRVQLNCSIMSPEGTRFLTAKMIAKGPNDYPTIHDLMSGVEGASKQFPITAFIHFEPLIFLLLSPPEIR